MNKSMSYRKMDVGMSLDKIDLNQIQKNSSRLGFNPHSARRVFHSILVFVISLLFGIHVSGQGSIYWTDLAKQWAHRSWKDGSNIDSITGPPILSNPKAIALNEGGEGIEIFLSDGSKIYKTDESGHPVDTLIREGISDVIDLVYSPVGELFWLDAGNLLFGKVILDENIVDAILTAEELSSPTAFAIDFTSDRIYIAEGNKVYHFNSEGEDRDSVDFGDHEIGFISDLDIASFMSTNKLIWLDTDSLQLRYAFLDGSDVELMSDTIQLTNASDFALDLTNDLVYFAAKNIIYNLTTDGVDSDTIVTLDSLMLYTPVTFDLVDLSDIALSPSIYCNEATILTQPQSQEYCEGDTALFAVVIETGTPPFEYQWHLNGEEIAGATGDTLIIADLSKANEGTYTVTISNECSDTISAEATLVVNENPEANILGNQLICKDQELMLDGNPSGGSGFYDEHLWSGDVGFLTSPVTEQVVTYKGTQEGEFLLFYEVTDTEGCEGSDDVIVKVNPPPVASAGPDWVICEGESAILGASVKEGGTGPFTYLWNVGDFDGDTLVVSPEVTTAYIVKITDALGCMDQDTVVVVVNPNPEVLVETNREGDCICESDPITIWAAPTLGDPDHPIVNYSWSNGFSGPDAIQQEVSPSETTTYTVTITDSQGCTATSSQEIVVFENPSIQLSVEPGRPIWEGEKLTITATVTGGIEPYTYRWFKDGSPLTPWIGNEIMDMPNVTENKEITYKVIVWDASGKGLSNEGCMSMASITIFVYDSPEIDTVTYNHPLWEDQQLQLCATAKAGNPPYYFSWSGPDGFTSNLQKPTIDNVQPRHAGRYSVTVTDDTGCPLEAGPNNTGFVDVIVIPPPTVTATNNGPICAGEKLQLDVTVVDNYQQPTYSWTGPKGFSSTLKNPMIMNAQPDCSGDYIVCVTDGDCIVYDTTNVLVCPLPRITLGPDDFICEGESVEIKPQIADATLPALIWWEDGSTGEWLEGQPNPPSRTVMPTETTTYAAYVIDDKGCISNTATITIHVGLLVDISGPSKPVCKLDKFTLTADVLVGPPGATYSYAWNKGTSQGDGSTIEDMIDIDMTYRVTVTDNSNPDCTGEASFEVKVSDLEVTINIDNDKVCTDETFIIRAIVKGGVPNYTYEWNTGNCIYNDCRTIYDEYETRFDVTRQYSVMVTDDMGCTATAQIVVEHLRKPDVSLVIDDTDGKLCEDELVTATATVNDGVPGYQYTWEIYQSGTYIGANDFRFIDLGTDSWSTPTSSRSYRPDKGSKDGRFWSFRVIVTDGQSPTCESRMSVEFNVLEKPDIRLYVSNGKDVVCEGDQITVRTEPTKGMPPYEIAWSDGLGTDSGVMAGEGRERTVCPPYEFPNPTSIGVAETYYTVTITDANMCSEDESKEISVRQSPMLTMASATEDKICEDESTVLQAEAMGGKSPYTFHWEKSTGEIVGTSTSTGPGLTVMPDEDTDYRVWVEDSNKCRGGELNGAGCFTKLKFLSVSVEVGEKIFVQIKGSDNNKKVCPGDAVVLEALATGGSGNYDYLWITGEKTKSITVNPNSTMNFGVNVKDKDTDCETSAIYTIQVKDAGSSLSLSTKVTGVNCTTKKGGRIELSISPSEGLYDYQWSNGSTSKNLSNLGPGTYSVVVTDMAGCGGTAITSATISNPGNLKVSFVKDLVSDTEVKLFARVSGGSGLFEAEGWGSDLSRNFSGNSKYTITIVDKESGCSVTRKGNVGSVAVRRSKDPNDMIGPEGFGEPKWVSANDVLPYKIRFENDPDFATAPAQVVRIEHVPDEDLNLFSMRVGEFGFANIDFAVPDNKAFYSRRLDVRDSLGIFVDVTAGIDVTENKIFWIFESIDPKTGLAPDDALAGLLPVNDSITRKGEGFVNFTIVPKSTSNTGDSILAKADIVFDINETIGTPEIFNVIDAVPPASQIIDNLPASTNASDFLISWSGEDDPGGSGIRGYKLYFSENGGQYVLLEEENPDTSVIFSGVPGNSYRFYTVAVDNTGNEEIPNTSGDLEIAINDVRNLSIVAISEAQYCVGDSLFLQWSASGIENVKVMLSQEGGGQFDVLEEGIDANTELLSWKIPDEFTGCDPCYIVVQEDASEIGFSDTITTIVRLLPEVSAGEDQSICPGHAGSLLASGAETYIWMPSAGLNSAGVADPIYSILESTVFNVTGTDEFGCQNSDELHVSVIESSMAFIESSVCTEEEVGVQSDTLTNRFGCDSIVVTSFFLDTIPPEINCPGEITLELDNTGMTLLSPDIYMNWISDNCGIDSVGLTTDIFTCEDVGEQSVVLIIKDQAGLQKSCGVSVQVQPSGACSLVISNEIGSSIESPCQCRGENLFDEEITVQSQTGEVWEVVYTTLLDSMSLDTIPAGTMLAELSAGSGLYRLIGAHRSGSGYELTVASSNYPELSLSFSNICYYPTINFVNLDEGYCESDPAFSIDVSIGNALGESILTIDGDTTSSLYPLGLGEGLYEVNFVFDAGLASPLDESDPGCITEISQIVDIKPAGHPLCTTEGNFFTFEYTGPDTLFTDENCETYLDFGDEAPIATVNFPPDQSVVNFELDPGLTGFGVDDPVPANTEVSVAYIVVDNFGNLDTFYFDVYISDDTAPMAMCSDTVLVLSEEGFGSLLAAEIGANSFDACGIESMNLSQVEFDTSDIGEMMVDLLVTDLNGNTATCQANVAVESFTTSVYDLPDYVNAIQIYPNPTLALMTLQLDLNRSVDLYVEIFTEQGELVYRHAAGSKSPGTYLNELDLEDFDAGVYTVKIGDLQGSYFVRNVVKIR